MVSYLHLVQPSFARRTSPSPFTVSLAVVPGSIRIGVSVASAPQQGTTRETETIEHDVLQVWIELDAHSPAIISANTIPAGSIASRWDAGKLQEARSNIDNDTNTTTSRFIIHLSPHIFLLSWLRYFHVAIKVDFSQLKLV